MNTDSILKKTINFYKKDVLQELEAMDIKKVIIDQRINDSNKQALVLALTDSTGEYTTELAQYYLLEGEDTKGVSKIEQGLYWIYYYILNMKLDNIVFRSDNLGFVIGLSWLFDKEDMLEKSILKLEEYWKLTNNFQISHNSFLYLLYKKQYSNILSHFVDQDSIYLKLIESIDKPNDYIVNLINEACDYHLTYTRFMGSKVNKFEFTWLPLYPYEIYVYLKEREKLGFMIPKMDHKLMNTLVAKADFKLSQYDIEKDSLLNLILNKLCYPRK